MLFIMNNLYMKQPTD